MKFRLTIFLSAVLITFNSCSQNAQNDQLQKVEIDYPDGSKKVRATTLNGKKEGISKSYYQNGNQQNEIEWHQDMQHGVTKEWFENGQLNFVGNYVNHKSDGEWKFYNRDNGTYIFSIFFKEGIKTDLKWSPSKYSWTLHNIPEFGIIFELPKHIDDTVRLVNQMISMYTMYPSYSKTDIEFFSVSRTNNDIISKDFETIIESLTTETVIRNDLGVQFVNASRIPGVPNIIDDKYYLTPIKKGKIESYNSYEFAVKFPELGIVQKHMIFKTEKYTYQISTTLNTNTSKDVETKFFKSIKLQ